MTADALPPDVLADIEAHLHRIFAPSFGRPYQVSEPTVSADGTRIIVTGAVLDALDGLPRLALYEAGPDGLDALTADSHSARSPAFAGHTSVLGYLSDERRAGEFQVTARDLGGSGHVLDIPAVPGSVESFGWSPDGQRLIVVTERSGQCDATRAAWIIEVGGSDPVAKPIVSGGCWEAAFVGSRAVALVLSDGSAEDDWYRCRLVVVDTDTARVIYERAPGPAKQVALPVASPDGRLLAWVESTFSDRRVIAGPVVICELATGHTWTADTLGADAAQLAWIDERSLGFLGQRHLDCIAAVHRADTGHCDELVATSKGIGGRWGPDGAFADDGSVVCVVEEYGDAQSIVRVSGQGSAVVTDLNDDGTKYLAEVGGAIEQVAWKSSDGMAIEGYLCHPPGTGPFPLVVNVHGGPVTAVRNTWSLTWPWVPLLVRAGYAVLSPNPRGSTGRGADFVAPVVGDMAGLDTDDLTSGVDAMVERGSADPARVGVIGISYGGFMATWLICRDPRFSAAVAIAPITDWYSQTFASAIGSWGRTFLSADPEDPSSRMHSRSPVLNASAIHTPCLLIAGGMDQLTPPGQARELYQALKERGVATQLSIYPDEGHGIRSHPSVADYLARIHHWFATHMPT